MTGNDVHAALKLVVYLRIGRRGNKSLIKPTQTGNKHYTYTQRSKNRYSLTRCAKSEDACRGQFLSSCEQDAGVTLAGKIMTKFHRVQLQELGPLIHQNSVVYQLGNTTCADHAQNGAQQRSMTTSAMFL